MQNKIQLRVTIVNPSELVVIEKNCPHSLKCERLAYGQKLATAMFSIGVFKEVEPSKIRAFPPHRIEDILIISS